MRISDPRPTQKADILSCSLHTPGKEVEAVSISPDGTLLVTGGRDGILVLMNLHVPSLLPRVENRITTAATVRRSCEILEQSCVSLSTSCPADETTASEENLRAEIVASEVIMDTHKEHNQGSHLIEGRPKYATASVVNLRRPHDKRMKEKVVDIPTMIAHLSARASIIEEPSSSSSGNSSSESEDDSDSDDQESQFLVNDSEAAGHLVKHKDTVQEIREPNKHFSPPSVLADNTPERTSKPRTMKGRQKSIFDEEEMDNVVLLMKNFLDDNRPSLVASGHQHSTILAGAERNPRTGTNGAGGNELDWRARQLSDEYGDEVPLSMI